jgi:hypothetical protein
VSAVPEQPVWTEELQRLVTGAQSWLREVLPDEAASSGPGEAHHHAAPGCEWCPVCQLVAAVRADHPELADKMTEAGAAVVSALRAVLEALAAPRPAPSAERSAKRRPRPGPGPAPRIQRIDLDAD